MYASETLHTTSSSRPLPLGGVRWLLHQVRSLLGDTGPAMRRGRLLHEVLRLDIVGETGRPPDAYGWHVNHELHVGWRGASEPTRMVAPEEVHARTSAGPESDREALVDPVGGPQSTRRLAPMGFQL